MRGERIPSKKLWRIIMQIISRFLKKNGIKDFDSNCLFVTADNDEYVLLEERFFVSEKSSLWTSYEAPDLIEFSLIQANTWENLEDKIVNKVFRIQKDQLSIEEIQISEKRVINILDGTQIAFSIEGYDLF